MKYRQLLIAAAVVVLAAGMWFARSEFRDVRRAAERLTLPEPITYEETQELPLAEFPQGEPALSPSPAPQEEPPSGSPPQVPPPTPSPQGINLAVPFTSQAPHGVWDAVHEETCEEAAVLMVDAFFDGRVLTPDSVEAELLALVDWQKQRFGYFEDTTAAEVAIIAREYYGYADVEVRYDITVADIEAVVRSNLPVIVPLDGRTIGNPFFSGEGPDYHMLVIRGLTKDGKFITNDPGTRRGEAYVYDAQVLWEAIYDWNGGSGPRRKAIIVMHP